MFIKAKSINLYFSLRTPLKKSCKTQLKEKETARRNFLKRVGLVYPKVVQPCDRYIERNRRVTDENRHWTIFSM